MSAVSGNEKRVVRGHGGRSPLAIPRRLLKLRSDSALAERYVIGDETAFDVIYERHRPLVLAVCMGVLGTADDAEDATQETFSSLAQELRASPPAEIRPWLIRVARNSSIDVTRRRKHRLLTFDGELPEMPARLHTGADELETVLDGIKELPENQRTALLMRELGGHSYNEIANALETDEESVKGLIARARVGLRGYREAADLPCTVARTAIETEPDGRRYDKTVRRHLRMCKPCNQYRTRLRGDAQALRSALPSQAGGVIGTGTVIGGGGITTGVFTAAKASMAGMALTQVAATCAASVCAVGAVGGIVILHPDHRLFGLTGARLSLPKHHTGAGTGEARHRGADRTHSFRHRAANSSATGHVSSHFSSSTHASVNPDSIKLVRTDHRTASNSHRSHSVRWMQRHQRSARAAHGLGGKWDAKAWQHHHKGWWFQQHSNGWHSEHAAGSGSSGSSGAPGRTQSGTGSGRGSTWWGGGGSGGSTAPGHSTGSGSSSGAGQGSSQGGSSWSGPGAEPGSSNSHPWLWSGFSSRELGIAVFGGGTGSAAGVGATGGTPELSGGSPAPASGASGSTAGSKSQRGSKTKARSKSKKDSRAKSKSAETSKSLGKAKAKKADSTSKATRSKVSTKSKVTKSKASKSKAAKRQRANKASHRSDAHRKSFSGVNWIRHSRSSSRKAGWRHFKVASSRPQRIRHTRVSATSHRSVSWHRVGHASWRHESWGHSGHHHHHG